MTTRGPSEPAEDFDEDDAEMFPSSSPDKKNPTGKDLLESGLVGIWKDRTDIGDSVEYARQLRERATKRMHDPLQGESAMATRRPSDPAKDFAEDADFAMPDEEKPKTGRELYEVLLKNGLIGFWKDRTDIGDTLEFVQRLKDRQREQEQEHLRNHPKN